MRTPASLRPFVLKLIERVAQHRIRDLEPLLDRIARDGAIRGVLGNLDNDDADAKEQRRGAWNWAHEARSALRTMPATETDKFDDFLEEVVLHGLRNEEPRWQAIAVRWLPSYVRDKGLVIRLLTDWLARYQDENREYRWAARWAALHLSELAPETPEVIDVLASALGEDWDASRYRSFEELSGGATMAAEALARLGPRARVALPALKAAACSERTDLYAANDRAAADLAIKALEATPE